MNNHEQEKSSGTDRGQQRWRPEDPEEVHSVKGGTDMPRGIAFALPIATRRGHVMIFIPSLFNLGDFIIAGSGRFVIVRIRFAQKISADIRQVEAELATTIAGLRAVPRQGPVSCELWLYSRYGTLRYFKVGDTGIEEIDSLGLSPAETPVLPLKTGCVETTAANAATVPASPPPPDPYEIFRRWHRKRNAVRKAAGIRDLLHPAILELMCRESNGTAAGKTGRRSPARAGSGNVAGGNGEGI
ncbi:MAG: hypothetical protein M0R30_05695 [Methanoregula sp.]|nr:hypothetical protein [Methanoregula sp.]